MPIRGGSNRDYRGEYPGAVYRIIVLVWTAQGPGGQGISFKEEHYQRACDLYTQRVGETGIQKVVMTLEYGVDSVILSSWEREANKIFRIMKKRNGGKDFLKLKMFWNKTKTPIQLLPETDE